jgi:hypothetical protein
LIAANHDETRRRVLVELAGAESTAEVRDVGVGERPPTGQSVRSHASGWTTS